MWLQCQGDGIKESNRKKGLMMIDVIAFLMENFQDFDACPVDEDLCGLLEEVGFDDEEIGDTLLFLSVLKQRDAQAPHSFAHVGSMRVYLPEERNALSVEALGLLHFLEANGALTPEQREFVLMALLHLAQDGEPDLSCAKALALLILWADKSELPTLIGDDLMAVLYGDVLMN